ncbi:MAG: DUF928 domain-containing protein [Microcoleaceae cyanobacterium]
MFWTKSRSFGTVALGKAYRVFTASCISMASLSFPLTATLAQAYPQAILQVSLEFPPSPDRGGVSSSAGGGTRGTGKTCTSGDIPLTALMPDEGNASTTVDAHPKFYTYIPETTAEQAEFVLVDAVGDVVYQTDFTLPGKVGIISIGLPKDVALEVGEEYTWQFVLLCDPDEPSEIEFVQGTVTRTELSNELKLKLESTKEPLEQAELLAGERVWLDTLALMTELRESNQKEWEQFLESENLEKIASAPLTACCSADSEPTE